MTLHLVVFLSLHISGSGREQILLYKMLVRSPMLLRVKSASPHFHKYLWKLMVKFHQNQEYNRTWNMHRNTDIHKVYVLTDIRRAISDCPDQRWELDFQKEKSSKSSGFLACQQIANICFLCLHSH